MKTVGYWAYWLFLYGIATIPAAFFAALIASTYIYVSNHGHRPRFTDQEYNALLDGGEIVAALILATPGFVWVVWSQLKDRKKEREKLQVGQRCDVQDDAVWPPKPLK